MKQLDKSIVVLFVLCLLFSAIIWPIIGMMTSEHAYITELEKVGIMPQDWQYTNIRYIDGKPNNTASLSRDQFKIIVKHITDFLSGKKKDFSLTLNNVILNGEIMNGVSIFGDTASVHMVDVRILFNSVKLAAISILCILAVIVIYMAKRIRSIGKELFKLSVKTLALLGALVLLFLLFVFVRLLIGGYSLSLNSYLSELWICMHYVFFPFDPDKFYGSIFNDALTYILTLDFFMNVVVNVLINLLVVITAWLTAAKFISKKTK